MKYKMEHKQDKLYTTQVETVLNHTIQIIFLTANTKLLTALTVNIFFKECIT